MFSSPRSTITIQIVGGYWQRHMEAKTQKVAVRTLQMSLTNWVMMGLRYWLGP